MTFAELARHLETFLGQDVDISFTWHEKGRAPKRVSFECHVSEIQIRSRGVYIVDAVFGIGNLVGDSDLRIDVIAPEKQP